MTTYIISAQRTPIASFQGPFKGLSAPQLGSLAIKGALKKAQVKEDQVSEVIMGQVLSAGAGQAPARQASLGADIPTSVPCTTINKVCGSGLKAVMMAADSIELGHSKVVVAGGQESMTQAPHLLKNSRDGFRMGPAQLVDSMIHDGLWDPYNDWHMGNAGEVCASEYQFSREAQDQFAKESYELAVKAQESGAFKEEITTVEVAQRKETITVSEDDEPKKVRFEKMPQLRPAFNKEGTITAANASKLNDGACALVLASEETVNQQNLKPIAKIIGRTTHAQDPKWFTTAPVQAMKKLSEQTNISLNDVDLFEINEAFSVVAMAAQKDLEIPREKINTHGGAVALGHPIGASGARILTTLVHALKTQNKKRGVASICLGGGEAVAVMVETV